MRPLEASAVRAWRAVTAATSPVGEPLLRNTLPTERTGSGRDRLDPRRDVLVPRGTGEPVAMRRRGELVRCDTVHDRTSVGSDTTGRDRSAGSRPGCMHALISTTASALTEGGDPQLGRLPPRRVMPHRRDSWERGAAASSSARSDRERWCSRSKCGRSPAVRRREVAIALGRSLRRPCAARQQLGHGQVHTAVGVRGTPPGLLVLVDRERDAGSGGEDRLEERLRREPGRRPRSRHGGPTRDS